VHAHQPGLAETARGDWIGGEKTAEDSLVTAESLQMAEERTISVATLADLDRLEGRMSSALEESDGALADFNKRKDQRGATEMMLVRSAIASDLGDWTGAAQAIHALDPSSAAEQASTLRWRLAEITFAQGQTEAALKAADEAIAEAVSAHSYAAELLSRLLKVRILGELSRRDAAQTELRAVKNGLLRYASMPLRLSLAETSVTGRAACAGRLSEARALLARPPAYGRAFAIHRPVRDSPPVAARSCAARRSWPVALDDPLRKTFAAQQQVLLDYAK
jgi:hypothetical protein